MKKPNNKYVRILQQGLIIGMVISFISCAGTRPPTEHIARSQSTINQAEQVGAENYAPLEIREARKKLDRANELIKEKEYQKAKRLAEQAEVDAELAEAKTLSEKAQKAVRELRESIRIIKEEISRNQNNR
jgi:hypothetical protein